jgi:uncharacterized protein YuzE
MKLHYHPETDSLYIDLNARPGVDAHEVADGVVLDLDADGNLVGIDIEHASRRLDLATLETEALPARAVRLG